MKLIELVSRRQVRHVSPPHWKVKKKIIQSANQILTGTHHFTQGAPVVEVHGKGLASLPQISLFCWITGTKVLDHETYCQVYFEM